MESHGGYSLYFKVLTFFKFMILKDGHFSCQPAIAAMLGLQSLVRFGD